MNELGARRLFPDQSSGSGQTLATSRQPVVDPTPSKWVCFYKSGDPQFNGLRMVINNRTFKTFDALLDSLSKKVPLPFGVRNITTPRGVHGIRALDELEDGKSYICSDTRKVKPINLALARKKLPPWYHARPISARRRVVQLARFYPGRAKHKQEPVVVRTPKRLMIFRNGDPSIRHTVMLQKRTTPTFESLLDHISELMQFHVVKLYIPDGRRVEGLPALILCPGAVVASGREPFKPGNYNVQKSPPPIWLPTNRVGPKRRKLANRKKKPVFHISKSRNFSPSSERYFVHQIQNSITESLCDFPSNPTDSVELETGHVLESVAETEEDPCPGHGTQHGCLPTEDDIEKSFRVNQDGSMTVEMKVRLTIKEEETVHWTTTLTRSSVANQLNASCLPEPEPLPQLDQDNNSPEYNPRERQHPATSVDTSNSNKWKDDDDNDPPSLDNGVVGDDEREEDCVKVQTNAVSPRRAPTPGPRRFRMEQASEDSIESVTAEEIREGTARSYSYREQTENGAVTEQYCVVKQRSVRPVPKPRRYSSVDVNNRNSGGQSAFQSAGMAEILQIKDSGEEVSESFLHMYEQQTCQDNFLANSHFCAQGVSMYGILYGRPTTSDTTRFSSSNDFETEPIRPSTASETAGIWSTDNISPTSGVAVPSLKNGGDYISPSKGGAIHVRKQQPTNTKGKHSVQLLLSKDNSQQKVVNKAKTISSKHKVINKHVRLMSPEKRRKENIAGVAGNRKKVKTFSSAGFLKKIYGYKPRPAKSVIKVKRKPTETGAVTNKSRELPVDTIKRIIKDPNVLSPVNVNKREIISFRNNMLDVSPAEESPSRGILRRQKSMHQERKNENESRDVNGSMSLPPLNSSSSVMNEYVENWLEQARPHPTLYPGDETQKVEVINQETGSDMSGESETNCDKVIAAEKPSCMEGKTEIQTCPSSQNSSLPDSLLERKVKQRIVNFENNSSPPLAKTIIAQELHAVHMETNNNKKPTNVKISVQKATPCNSISMDKPPIPTESPVGNTEISSSEHCGMEESSVASSPLYGVSSDSLTSEDRPPSISPTSDQTLSPTDKTLESTTSIQTNIPPPLREAPLSRNSSVKRARLVSNLSFERKMSLRKASLEKSTLTSDSSLETTKSSRPITTAVENSQSNSLFSMETQQPGENILEKTPPSNRVSDLASLASSPSNCMSSSPTSLTSEERASDSSLSSSDVPLSTNPFQKTKATKTTSSTLTQNKVSSPKPQMKNAKLSSNLSLEQKVSTIKASSESGPPNNLPAEKIQVSSSPTLGRTPLPRNHSLKSASPHNHSLDKTTSPKLGIRQTPNDNSSSPSTKRKLLPRKTPLQKRLSPYSQSMEVVSPTLRPKSKRRLLSKNLSLDNESEPTNQTLRNSPSQRKRQTPLSKKPTAELPNLSMDNILTSAATMPLNTGLTGKNEKNKTDRDDRAEAAAQEQSTKAQITPQPLKLSNQPNIKPVLEELCYSIKLIGQITQNKRPSCLEKSNSLPDFSGHVASTFGSSSKALLAFLSVMTLKEGMTNLNREELNANNVSCAEALKMIDSLREIASIEDSDTLKTSLSDLQKSASKQLLQSWKGFQELSDKCKSRSPTPNYSDQELMFEASCVEACGTEENVIDELMNELDVPEMLKEELAALPKSRRTASDDEGKMGANIIGKVELSPEEKVNQTLVRTDQATKGRKCEFEEEEDKQPSTNSCAIFNISSGESIASPDVIDQTGSEEDQTEAEWKELNAIIEENLSGSEGDLDTTKEEQGYGIDVQPGSKEGREEDKVSLEGDKCRADSSGYADICDQTSQKTSQDTVRVRLSSWTENKDSYIIKDDSGVIKQFHSLGKQCSADVDEDSGNDHRSCEEQAEEVGQVKTEREHSSSIEYELSYEEKECSTEEEHANINRHPEEAYSEYWGRDAKEKLSKEGTKCKKPSVQPSCHPEEIILQSVAERVGLLEKQVADAHQRKNTDTSRIRPPEKSTKVPFVSNVEDSTSETRTSPPALCVRSAPQSSLSFSYDSNGVITKEPEGNRVKSIKEMFLAKSVADVQCGQRSVPKTNTLKLFDNRPGTLDSGGYQSQASSELSSAEDDSPQKSITKGFVRKTIELLYGKKDTVERGRQGPPSSPKQKKKDDSSIFSPFHIVSPKVLSDLSYFNSASTLETLTEATRCIAFNAQVRPGVPVDQGRWLLTENTVIRKSASDPSGISKTVDKSPQDEDKREEKCEETQENIPYSLFSTKSEVEDKSLSTKCTYFSLPHASDSDACQDDLSTVSTSAACDSTAERIEASKETKMQAERNGILPAFIATDLKMPDNKVHPLIEGPPDCEVVVVQPTKGHSVVRRRPQEPDLLEVLYTFCGQHCPIL